MKTIGIVVAWAMCALLVLILLLVPLARHADRRGRPGLLHGAVANLRRLTASALLALAVAFGGSVAHSGKNTNGVQNLPPRPLPPVSQTAPVVTPSIFDYPRTVTETRAASGIALTGVGTNETFTFDPPTNATVCADWRALGSFSRWAHVSPTNFAFPFGGTNATTFTFLPGGVAYLAGGADAPRIAPFDAEMGIAPERYWDSVGVTSRLWTATSPSNTFLATWQGALLGRRADRPVDVQIEFFPDGGFDFRYDLSRLASDDALADARIGAWNADGGETYSVPHRNLTSARWRPVVPDDATDPDRDNDGVTTVDELFFLGTAPGNPDSDFDGLSDGDEIAHGLNPLDPYSNGGPYPDGFALKIGDLNPLASPPGSDYTFYEHIVYSGSTNGIVSIPESAASGALLEVSVSETGTGDLVVGTQSLPLVGGAPTVYVPVPRGDRLSVRLRRRTGSLSVSLDSGDFAIGEMPDLMDGDPSGWISFPRTVPVPEVACIHDLSKRKITVRIEPGYGEEGLSCNWWGTAAVAASNHADNLSATLTGNFDAHHTARVWYALDHPLRLLGMGSYWQAVRFCPRPPDASDEPVDDPWDDPWYEPDPTAPGPYDDLYGGDGASPGTHPTPCDCCPSCPLNGGAGCEHHTPAPSEVSGPAPSDPQSLCPVHNCPYSECADLHGDAAPRTAWVPTSTHVLKIGRMPTIDTVALMVPDGVVNCCPCPDHWTNWVGVAHLPDHVAVKGDDGLDFWKSETDCTAYVSGTSPTRLSERASLAFATNGTIHIRRNYAVLGVDIDTPSGTAETLNALNPAFGIPATVCTNAGRAAGIDLVTRVRLAAGAVTLTAGSGAFQAWLDRSGSGDPPLLLVDGETRPTVTMSLAKWRSLARLTGDEDEARTRILLTSATPGARTLTFSFSAGGALTDSVTQRITFVNPPLLPDYNRDGVIDELDVAAYLSGRTFRFWTNEDVWDGDDAFDYWLTTYAFGNPNGSDGHVNGRCDMVNLFPLAVDVRSFVNAWGSGATFCLRPRFPSSVPTLRYQEINLSWDSVADIHEADVPVAGGGMLHDATLTSLAKNDVQLSASLMAASTTSSATLAVEASRSLENPIDLVITVNGEEVYSFTPPTSFSSIEKMYRWMNLRAAAGGTVGGAEFASRLGDPENSPDSEHCGNAHVVFVHGYNVSEKEAKYWGEGVYKRLWWSGLDARFTTVAWYGNDGQYWLPGHGFITPDYQVNVEHAFATAATLANELNQQGGKKFVIAHSLGNMLVSAAIQDHGLQYGKFLMLNAAVPLEAYDTNAITPASRSAMTPEEWLGYSNRVRAAHWNELFDSGDWRRSLTWRGRFSAVTNAVNYYSEDEEVLANGDGTEASVGRTFAWYYQETHKGIKQSIPLFGEMGRNEAGWSFNTDHDHVSSQYVGDSLVECRSKLTNEEACALSNSVLRVNPFFGHFADNSVYSPAEGIDVNTNAVLRARFLADAIPAESLAAGRNRVPAWDDSNIEMRRQYLRDVNLSILPSTSQKWIHSFFLQVPYCITGKLFEALKSQIEE